VAAAGLLQWFALRQNSAEAAEEEVSATKALLSEIYERRFADEEAWSVLSSCPEIGWLVECYCRAPLPPNWRKSNLIAGEAPRFANEDTGEVTTSPPWFKYFTRLAQLVLRARLVSSSAGQAKYLVRTILQETRALAGSLEARWSGPHIDPSTESEYYHCPESGVSVWDNPSSWAKFVVSVAEKLLESDAFTDIVECAPAISAAKPTAEAQQAQRPAATETKRVQGPTSPVFGGLQQDGDAWGALDALIADTAASPKNQVDLAGTAAPKAPDWSEMEQWITSQQKMKARPAVATVATPARSSAESSSLKVAKAALPAFGPPAVSEASSAPAAVPKPSTASAKPKKTTETSGGGYPSAASKKASKQPPGPASATPPPPAPAKAAAPKEEAGGNRAELQKLADRLTTVAAEDSAAICSILEALEKIPVTIDDLAETKLGVLTQPYKDSADKKVKVVAKRLRLAWKDTLKKGVAK